MNRTAVPSHVRGERPTDRQAGFIRGLIAERVLDSLSEDQRKWLADEYAKPMEFQFAGVSVSKASDIISKLLSLPRRPDISADPRQNAEVSDVPAGRYAIENEDGELRFYRLWIGENGYKKLYVLHGPDASAIPYPAMISILKKIETAGIAECAVRFGQEIGACSNCGRRLTNRISRELGIGPICGDRYFGDEWAGKVANARQSITDRGEDPDEELEHDDRLNQEEMQS